MTIEPENTSSSQTVNELSSSFVSTNFLSDETAILLQWILFTVVCQAIDLLGVVANIINIVCFTKQGFKDIVNISLTGLAVSDIGCLSTLIWTNLCYTPAFMTVDLPFDSVELQYLTTGMIHIVFTRITSWITAFITLERCLCITMPLKVKTIITSTRVTVIMVSMFIILIFSAAPVYVSNRLDLKFYPHKNRTLIGIISKEGYESVTQLSYTINNVILPIISFVVTIVCTLILVIYLHKITKWRNITMNVTQSDNMSTRNKNISKMVVLISTLFIASFIPSSIIFIAISLEPEFFIDGKYRNMFILLGGLGIILESTNSSANILIYYNMSNKYRIALRQLFRLSRSSKRLQ